MIVVDPVIHVVHECFVPKLIITNPCMRISITVTEVFILDTNYRTLLMQNIIREYIEKKNISHCFSTGLLHVHTETHKIVKY